jgi:hypothetical protein
MRSEKDMGLLVASPGGRTANHPCAGGDALFVGDERELGEAEDVLRPAGGAGRVHRKHRDLDLVGIAEALDRVGDVELMSSVMFCGARRGSARRSNGLAGSRSASQWPASPQQSPCAKTVNPATNPFDSSRPVFSLTRRLLR